MLRRDIREGLYKPGEKLPTHREIAAKYDVARGTVRSAISLLRADGVIQSWQGKGTFVVDPGGGSTDGQSADYALVVAALEQLATRVEALEERVGVPEDPDGPHAAR